MNRVLGSFGAALIAIHFGAGSQITSTSPQQAARNIEQAIGNLRSLQADFEQSYYSASLATPLVERGTLFLQKPDRMRWEYREPEANVYVYKEGLSLAYFPEDNQLYRHALTPEEKDGALFSLLTGKSKLTETYSIEVAEFPTVRKAPVQLKLIPGEEGEVSYILIEADPRTWLLETVIFMDWAGNKQEFRFSGIRVNPRLDHRIFEIEVPPGCEVVDDLPPVKNG